MTTPMRSINCAEFGDRLADVLERETDEATRAGVEAHAAACADCGALLDDLRALRIQSANLPELVGSGLDHADPHEPVAVAASGSLVERHRPLVLPAPVAVVRAVDDHGSPTTICMAPF